MRRCPPMSVIPRQAVRDTTVGNYTIKAGTTVFANAYGPHRRAEVFEPGNVRPGPLRTLP